MLDEIDVHEEGDLALRKAALGDEEAALQRLGAGAADGCQHVFLVDRMQRADFNVAAIPQLFGSRVVFRGRHRVSSRP